MRIEIVRLIERGHLKNGENFPSRDYEFITTPYVENNDRYISFDRDVNTNFFHASVEANSSRPVWFPPRQVAIAMYNNPQPNINVISINQPS